MFSPAYWKLQAWLSDADEFSSHRLGETLTEEAAACLLGGHGIPAEVGLAAFVHLRDLGLLSGPPPSSDVIARALAEPLIVGPRRVRYRFVRQKAHYLNGALTRLAAETPDSSSGRAFRQWFLGLSGFGPKTASWVARNWLGADDVAIIDVHIFRAGIIAKLFSARDSIQRAYFDLEERFLHFAYGLGVATSMLDALMWRDMRRSGELARRLLPVLS
jgi:thermostable 8-oxoguanine DNA glycosylase